MKDNLLASCFAKAILRRQVRILREVANGNDPRSQMSGCRSTRFLARRKLLNKINSNVHKPFTKENTYGK